MYALQKKEIYSKRKWSLFWKGPFCNVHGGLILTNIQGNEDDQGLIPLWGKGKETQVQYVELLRYYKANGLNLGVSVSDY